MNVGEYARSSEGDFGKIVRINNSHDIELEDSWVSYDEEDLKSSPNIIDLIEVGDCVNGRLVEWKSEDFVAFGRVDYAYEEDIKSIVTRKMFESMEYKVKE